MRKRRGLGILPYLAVVASLIMAFANVHDGLVLFPSLLSFVGWMAYIDLLRSGD